MCRFPGNSLCLAASPVRVLARYVAFPRAKYYRRVRLPQRRRHSYGWSFQSAYSTRLGCGPRPSGISQVPGASLCIGAVLLDPAAVSGSHRLYRLPTVAFQVFDLVGRQITTHEAQSLHLHYGPDAALSTLSSCRCLHQPKTRFPVRWLGRLPGREFHPLEAPGFSWRTEKSAHI